MYLELLTPSQVVQDCYFIRNSSHTIRIFFAANKPKAKFRFRLLPSEVQMRQVEMIVEKENVKISQNAIDKLIEVAGGDMRKATTFLQSLHRLNSEEISPTEVMDVAALCDNDRIASIIKAASEITFDKLIIKIRELLLDGYPACQFLTQLLDQIVDDETIEDSKKIPIIEQIGQADYALNDGADEELQLIAVCSVMF